MTQESSQNRHRSRVVVFGIDGAPYTLLTRFCDEGVMPHLSRLRATGILRQMDVSLPEVSSVSWTSFATGVNPGKHGIYGFSDLVPRQKQLMFPNATHVKSPAVWELLGQHGRTSMVVNLPQTYPARPLRGAMISGFVAPELTQAVYPRILLPRLKAMDYALDVDTHEAHSGDLPGFLASCRKTLQGHAKAFSLLWTHQTWDLFIATVTATDRLHHFLWDANEPSHPLHAEFIQFYRAVDDILGELLARMTPADTLLIVSDHGFTAVEQELYVNRWLEAEGLLTWQFPAEGKAVPHPSSLAFALDPGRIYLNTRRRFEHGILSDDDAEQLLNRLLSTLPLLTCPSSAQPDLPVLEKVLRGSELFAGAQAAEAPDLLLLGRWGIDVKAGSGPGPLFGRSRFTGMHTRDDATFFISRKDVLNRRPHIIDLTPTILALLGLPLPAHLDGQSLLAQAG